MKKILFVCLGNICRSPLAEAIFNKLLKENKIKNIECDSAGTSDFHVNEKPDERTIEIAEKYNTPIHHFGRQFNKTDFTKYDYIIAMDNSNLKNILLVAEKYNIADLPAIKLMRDYDTLKPSADVPDPWYGNMNDFDECYKILERCCENFLEEVRQVE